MTAPNRATLQARVLVDELVRCGVRDVCLAPGSRSTPLVLAAARHEAREAGDLRLRVFLDERSAAFFALGVGKATGRPAAVLTTSGTAAANLLPAVVEAAQAETPLLLLTADRPPRLRDADANQAIDQVHLFGRYTRFFADLGPPLPEAPALRHLRGVAARAVAAAVGLPAGPAHLNVPFDKPLEPVAVAGDVPTGLAEDESVTGRAGGRPWVSVGPKRPRASTEELEALAAAIGGAERPVIVAGPHPEAGRLGPALRAVAAAARAPLLADPLSGGRFGPADGATVVAAYDLILGGAAGAGGLRPDLVVRVGASPTSASLLGWLERWAEVPQAVIDGGGRWKDHLARATHYLQADAVDLLERLAARGLDAAPVGWSERWARVDRAAVAAAVGPGVPAEHEGRILAAVAGSLPAGTPLFVSSSMPVRDLDAFGGAGGEVRPVFGNRGASGIDGIVSTALGVATGSGRAVVAVVGDLALLHDVNGLLATREPDARVVFVVINNDGGGIFHLLPIREQEPDFTPYFATPHGIEPARAAALYGVPHALVETSGALPSALREALAAGESRILEIRTDRERNREARETVAAAVERAVADELSDEST